MDFSNSLLADFREELTDEEIINEVAGANGVDLSSLYRDGFEDNEILTALQEMGIPDDYLYPQEGGAERVHEAQDVLAQEGGEEVELGDYAEMDEFDEYEAPEDVVYDEQKSKFDPDYEQALRDDPTSQAISEREQMLDQLVRGVPNAKPEQLDRWMKDRAVLKFYKAAREREFNVERQKDKRGWDASQEDLANPEFYLDLGKNAVNFGVGMAEYMGGLFTGAIASAPTLLKGVLDQGGLSREEFPTGKGQQELDLYKLATDYTETINAINPVALAKKGVGKFAAGAGTRAAKVGVGQAIIDQLETGSPTVMLDTTGTGGLKEFPLYKVSEDASAILAVDDFVAELKKKPHMMNLVMGTEAGKDVEAAVGTALNYAFGWGGIIAESLGIEESHPILSSMLRATGELTSLIAGTKIGGSEAFYRPLKGIPRERYKSIKTHMADTKAEIAKTNRAYKIMDDPNLKMYNEMLIQGGKMRAEVERFVARNRDMTLKEAQKFKDDLVDSVVDAKNNPEPIDKLPPEVEGKIKDGLDDIALPEEIAGELIDGSLDAKKTELAEKIKDLSDQRDKLVEKEKAPERAKLTEEIGETIEELRALFRPKERAKKPVEKKAPEKLKTPTEKAAVTEVEAAKVRETQGPETAEAIAERQKGFAERLRESPEKAIEEFESVMQPQRVLAEKMERLEQELFAATEPEHIGRLHQEMANLTKEISQAGREPVKAFQAIGAAPTISKVGSKMKSVEGKKVAAKKAVEPNFGAQLKKGIAETEGTRLAEVKGPPLKKVEPSAKKLPKTTKQKAAEKARKNKSKLSGEERFKQRKVKKTGAIVRVPKKEGILKGPKHTGGYFSTLKQAETVAHKIYGIPKILTTIKEIKGKGFEVRYRQPKDASQLNMVIAVDPAKAAQMIKQLFQGVKDPTVQKYARDRVIEWDTLVRTGYHDAGVFLTRVRKVLKPKDMEMLLPLFEKHRDFAGKPTDPVRNFVDGKMKQYYSILMDNGIKANMFVNSRYIKPYILRAFTETAPGGYRDLAVAMAAEPGRVGLLGNLKKIVDKDGKPIAVKPRGNAVEMMSAFQEVTAEAMAHRGLTEAIKAKDFKLPDVSDAAFDRGDGGKPASLIMEMSKADELKIKFNRNPQSDFNPPADWYATIHSPALSQALGHKSTKTMVVHPAAAKAFRQIYQEKLPFFHKFEILNSLAKAIEMTMSFFHPHALWESAMGFTSNTKSVLLAMRSHFAIPGKKLYHIGIETGMKESVTRTLPDGKRITFKPGHLFAEMGIEAATAGRKDIDAGLLDFWLRDQANIGLPAALRKWQKNEAVKWLGETKKGGFKLLADAKRFQDRWLWDTIHRGYKMHYGLELYTEALHKFPERFKDPATALETKRIIGNFVNEGFGGLNWTTRFEASPVLQQMSRLIMLAPDWTYSQILVSSGYFKGLAKGDPLMKHFYGRYMRRMMMSWFATTQLANYAINGESTLGHEPGKKFHVKLWQGSAIAKAMPGWMRQLTGVTEHSRYTYLHGHKQLYEVLFGWLEKPEVVFGNKMSPVLSEMISQLTKHEPGSGFPTSFSKVPLFSIEGWTERAKHAISIFRPFSLGPNQFGLMFPLSKGSSAYKAAHGIAEHLKDEISWDPTTWSKTKQERIGEWLDAAEKNGLDTTRIFGRAKNLSNSELYDDFFTSWTNGSTRGVNKAVEALNGRGLVTKQGFLASMRGRPTGKGPTNKQDSRLLLKAFRAAGGKTTSAARIRKKFNIKKKPSASVLSR